VENYRHFLPADSNQSNMP